MIKFTIYKIYNDGDVNDDNIYIGSTTRSLYYRWHDHKINCRKGIGYRVHEYMREKGLENFKCVELYSETTNDPKAQKRCEQLYVDALNPSLNINNVDGCTNKKVDKFRKKEPIDGGRVYRNKHEKKRKEYHKEYCKKYSPAYYKKNRKALREKSKRYHSLNGKSIAAQKKEKNDKIKASGVHTCFTCNLSLTSASALKTHRTSKKHKQLVFEEHQIFNHL